MGESTEDVIVVATEDFKLYHEAVTALRDRGTAFCTIEPGDELPSETDVVITTPPDRVSLGNHDDAEMVFADAENVRAALEEALAILRPEDGRTIVGVDPGPRPGIAVLVGDVVVAGFRVPLADAPDRIRSQVEDAADPLVRVGDGDRLKGGRIVNALDEVPVELVDETGTTPYLGPGVRDHGLSDVLAAVNVARISGDRIDSRDIDPTDGELQRIRDRSREASDGERTIDESLARRVAGGELTVDEALAEHREG
ncbi:MAG: hypothetical protein A07HR60_00307 [uncultured archaeon A07HR60]|nr:MAG: hypothetical protein A07HR60_00307 [uncultured archaeon A07HR60]